MTFDLQANKARKRVAFTLVETLVVLAIMGILAALLIPTAMHTAESRKITRVKSDLTLLETTIDSYYHKMGHYPPDNPKDPGVPPLFYELAGANLVGTDYVVENLEEKIPVAAVSNWFGRGGFVNSNPETRENFFKGTLRTNQYREINSNPDVEVMVVSVSGKPYTTTNGVSLAGNFNTWRYNSSKPIHNPGRYDLWAEIVVGNKTLVIGNWKQEK